MQDFLKAFIGYMPLQPYENYSDNKNKKISNSTPNVSLTINLE